ncbi:MAG: diguanylate cyclase [Erythrobacter sp.]|uniref:GGDEF domain-containing protein n=1 Tax=Erythrobacter sp. TaxID=1042 RepID=UPI003265A528
MQTQILGMLTPLMALLFAATFAVFWKVAGMRRHVLGFAFGYLFFAMGFLVTHLLPGDAIYTFHTTQLFYSISSALFVISTCERVGQRAHIPTLVGIYVISALVLALAISLTNDVGPRVILLNIGYGCMFMVNFVTLLIAQRRDWIDIAILFSTALQALDFFLRPSLTVMFEQTIPTEEYRQSLYYSLIGLSLGVKSILGAMVLIGATMVDWTRALRERSEKDPLTALHNRAAFEDVMRTLLPKAHMENTPVSLVVADIDHFKQVNDIWGHQSGDRAIASFGKLINEMIRGCDTAGRVGGEEFCIAVWNCPNEPAERLAERIRQAFAQVSHEGLNCDIRLTASFGVATQVADENYERLFARADEALYEAKSRGRNRVENAERSTSFAVAPTPQKPDQPDLKSVAAR